MRISSTAFRRATARLPERGDEQPVVTLTLHDSETFRESQLRIRGAGVGNHSAHVRFDRGELTFNEVIDAEWVGDRHVVDLPFVPTAAIATIDGSDEIRL